MNNLRYSIENIVRNETTTEKRTAEESRFRARAEQMQSENRMEEKKSIGAESFGDYKRFCQERNLEPHREESLQTYREHTGRKPRDYSQFLEVKSGTC